MRTRTRSQVLTALVTGLLITGGGLAAADDISNTIDATVDTVAEVMPLNVGGANGTTQLTVTPRNGDGKSGCNLTAASKLSLSVTSSNPAVATVSPSSVTFESCGDTKTVTVTPVALGSATVSVSQTSNNTGGTFNLAPAAFTVNVVPPPNTAPAIAVTGVTGGAIYDKGAVPTASCQVTDAEDGNSSFVATLSPPTGIYASDGLGNQTASCSYTDGGGLTASASETYTIVDPSAPVIASSVNPASPDGDNGWYKSNVSLTWNVSEPESPNSLQKTDCADQSITADQAATTYSCSATSAGGSAGPVDVTIKRDATAPSVSYTSAAGTAGSNGWFVTPVTATFTATDATSGPASATATAASVGQGSNVLVGSPAFTDNAGNTTPAGQVTESFKIDLDDPTATFNGNPVGSVYFGSVPPAPTCSASDPTSGPAGCSVTGYSTAVGSHTLTATATDNAGRTGTATQAYTVLPWTARGFYQPVDMGSTVNTVKGGSTVPVKFELFAGSTELTATDIVSLNAVRTSCSPTAQVDEIEVLAPAGSTVLRYDTVAGQYVYNWKTPTGAGSCYRLTMTAADGSTLSANFRTK
ncbi:PxKF domain-containing protein [Geodermatophilus sp. URMC 64]